MYERARATYEKHGEVVAVARVDARLADVDFNEGHPPQAVARVTPALAALEATGSEQRWPR